MRPHAYFFNTARQGLKALNLIALMIINIPGGLKAGFKSKERKALLALIVWILIHFLFYKNEQYTISSPSFTFIKNVNENLFNAFIYKHYDNYGYFIRHTSIRYFGVFPEWTFNIIYLGYFVIAAWGVLYIKDKQEYIADPSLDKTLSEDQITDIIKDLQIKLKAKYLNDKNQKTANS